MSLISDLEAVIDVGNLIGDEAFEGTSAAYTVALIGDGGPSLAHGEPHFLYQGPPGFMVLYPLFSTARFRNSYSTSEKQAVTRL